MPSRSVLSRIAILAALGLAAVAPAAAADLTEAQRQERCANNRARLAEVVRRLAAPDMMSAEEIIRARNEAACSSPSGCSLYAKLKFSRNSAGCSREKRI